MNIGASCLFTEFYQLNRIKSTNAGYTIYNQPLLKSFVVRE